MKVYIEIPTWLGDAVMCTPAIENIVKAYPEVKITLFGTVLSTEIFKNHPNVEMIIIDRSRNARFRFFWLMKKAKSLGIFDAALSFRSSFTSRVLIYFMNAQKKTVYRKNKDIERHQVLRYNDLVQQFFCMNPLPNDLQIYMEPEIYATPTLGINPGASYGSAKRWYPEKFAAVAVVLHKKYDIVIFGGPSEVDIAGDIEAILKKNKITNYHNIAGQTDIETLCKKIGGLSLFITGDSGPMHVAAAFKIPTVALFGPTKDKETSQWHNTNSIIVKKEMECAPCMKRTCPLKHHECMKFITAEDVLEAVKKLA